MSTVCLRWILPPIPLHIEHIIPTVRGGTTTLENLGIACSGCNGHKYDKQDGYDLVSEQSVLLYHPRQHIWRDHFAWNDEYTHIIGLTPTGRTTISTLHLNRSTVVNLCVVLILVGLHPPEDTTEQE